MIDKKKALQMLIAKVLINYTHPDYQRTIEHAALMKKFVTGEDVSSLLKQFVPRESEMMFKQRADITQAIVKPISAKALRPVRKIQRVNPLVKSVSYEGDDNNQKGKALMDEINKFNGGQPL